MHREMYYHRAVQTQLVFIITGAHLHGSPLIAVLWCDGVSDCHIISSSNEYSLVQVTSECLLSKPTQSIYSHKSVLEEGWRRMVEDGGGGRVVEEGGRMIWWRGDGGGGRVEEGGLYGGGRMVEEGG